MAIRVTGRPTDGGPPTRRTPQGHLAGPSRRLDRRINAVRDDLANAALAGVVTAPRYADGVYRRGAVPAAMVRSAADDDAVAVSAVLFGEVFVVFDVVGGVGGWCWGQCLDDGYVGWVRTAALAAPGVAAVSHVVAAPVAPVFARAEIKANVVATLPLGARIAVVSGSTDAFVATAAGFIHHRHLRAVTEPASDPVAIALGFVGTPYVWGGRTRDGLDCSGLTQLALRACGVFCPRDSDQQAAAFPAVPAGQRRRGDLVAFPGHVGILADAETLVHANAYWMAVVVEPLADAAGRLAASGFHRPPLVAATSC